MFIAKVMPINIKRVLSTFLISTFLLGLYGIMSKPENDPNLKSGIRTVVIDAGHGGKDPGAIGTRAKEKDIAPNIALKVGYYIEKNIPDVKVVYTRKEDVYVASLPVFRYVKGPAIRADWIVVFWHAW